MTRKPFVTLFSASLARVAFIAGAAAQRADAVLPDRSSFTRDVS